MPDLKTVSQEGIKEMKKRGVYSFINLKKVMFRNFSLYTKNDEVINVEEKINNGVYCLAGANGLGKTTFLNAINYGLTGIVLEPNKEVFSPNKIVGSNKRYTTRYFKGRIKAKDIANAEIEILFTVNNKFFRIIRGFTNREELKLLEIYKEENGKQIFLLDTLHHNSKTLKSKYEQALTEEVGINKFENFIFFQLYVLTFDEHRRMIFWDDRASTTALSMAFNYDLADVEKLLHIRGEMQKLESAGRNARWQATQIKNNIKKLRDTENQGQETEILRHCLKNRFITQNDWF